MNKKTVFTIVLIVFSLTACSSEKEGTDPRIFPPVSEYGPPPPSLDEPGLPVPGISAAPPLNAPVPIPKTDDFPAVTLMNMDGSVLTMWSRGAGSSLWAYYIRDSNSFGELRNWQIMPGTRKDTIQFRNVAAGTCMTSFPGFKGGFQLSTAPCEFGPDRFDFRLMSTRNGNYQLLSLSTGLCIRAEFLGRTPSSPYATTLSMKRCPSGSENNYEFMWSISEPLRPALATITKPEFRPFPPPQSSQSNF
ncbi:toxin [Salmonella enterica subsp. enterica]|nr:toxin [Salmonella enterica subsp. enterica]ECH9152524.1 toxin [Salmonella enterica subsp. enterica]EGI5886247.1 toxin [Salmonella enterica subsp. enterica serovar Magwa]